MKNSISIAAAAVAALMSQSAGAQTIEMIVPFSAGGGTDTVARAFEPAYSKALDQTIVIRNLDGASGTIGAGAVAKAKADGSTLGYLPIGISIQPLLRETSYNLDGFSYICQTTSTPMFLLTQADSDFDTVADVVAAGKDGRVLYGAVAQIGA